MSNCYSNIVIENIQRERKCLSKYACLSNKGIRKFPDRERIPDRENIRPTFFHDTDKIIHSLVYTRYIDKTQVFFLIENDHITKRVLHVQLVSKIGRVIGRSLKLNEDLIEAIALGHDIGHAPFGHKGEIFLNEICQSKGIGYFCHNAQSVKYLTEIEQNGNGLNLTLQVLDGILSHNGEFLCEKYKPVFGKTWKDFEEEYNKCFKIKDYSKKIYPMTIEGCVVRISDIIAYIGRDIEDAILVKLIERKDIPKKITKYLGSRNDKIINNLVMDLIKNSYNKDYLCFNDNIFKAFKELFEFNFQNIYLNEKVKKQSEKVKHIFYRLFESYHNDIVNNIDDSPIFKKHINKLHPEYLKNTNKYRIVIDFLSAMTDDFFMNQFKERFLPHSSGYYFD